MDKDQILNSGLLEQYVLGLTTEEESRMVEALAAEHEEVRQELITLRRSMEQFAAEQGAPASSVKNPGVDRSNLGLRKLNGRVLWPLATAFVFLWGVSAALRSDIQHQQLREWQTRFAMLEKECDEKQHSIQTLADHTAFIQHRHTSKVILNGQSLCQGHFAIAFWNPAAEKCYVDLGSMPPAPKGKTYQVWADVDGCMVNAGIVHCGREGHLQEVRFIPNASSINITLEPEGGSEEPTIERLQANGLLASN